MDSSLLFFCIVAVIAVQVQTQPTPEFTVSILEESPLFVSRGPSSAVSISCHVNMGLQLTLTHDIEWIKLSRVPGLVTNESLVIAKGEAIIVPDHPSVEHYGINLLYDDSSLTSVLSLKKVEATDDGRYECRVTKITGSSIDGSGSVDIIVPNDVESLQVEINNVTVTTSPTTMTPGRHTLRCAAEGSNPPANVSFWMDNQPLKLNHVYFYVMRDASSIIGAPRFSVEGEATLQLSKDDTGKELRVTAGNKTFKTQFAVVAALEILRGDSDGDVSESQSVPAIAGGVGGVIVVVVVIIIITVVVLRRRKATKKTTSTLSPNEETHPHVNQAAIFNNDRSDDNEDDDVGNYIEIISNVDDGEAGINQPALAGDSIYQLPTRRSQVVDTNIYTGLEPQSQGNYDCQETETTQHQNTATQQPMVLEDTRRALNQANKRESTDQTDYEIL